MRLSLVRCIGTTSKIWKNHYEVLEVSTQATQAQIKAAYYRLSLIYHPDRNEGNSAKFHAITAAYEVLGNYNSRKLYDRGLTTIYEGTADASAKSEPFKDKYRMPTASGRTVVYDYDEWTRAHYGHNFARRNAAKERYEWIHKSKAKHTEFKKIQNVVFVFVTFFILITFASQYRENLDVPIKTQDSDKSSKP
ncbi:dnaJ homolog subfamily C member 30-like [Cimex lectularius]|uniref:J domain-containing protein n=1 Tax=Cimex lectularius TaxID=79782 RepID=A0A8I6RJX1_CIMLE|nr:dnaJ homolog subfamily C member 30-like [Cimex lectularius]